MSKDTEKRQVLPPLPFDPKMLLHEFVHMTTEDVLGRFRTLPGARCIAEKKDKREIHGTLVLGTLPPEQRLLLVAHADTVRRSNALPKTRWIGDVLCSMETQAFGGDDRCGCAMLWALANSGHTLLVTNGEESGCSGSQALLECPPVVKALKEHNYAIQIDRRGDRQAVFYDVGTKPFEDYIIANATKHDHEGYEWSVMCGSGTDIKLLCPRLGFCGVNFSAGYLNEHMSAEMIIVGAWVNTYRMLCGLFTEPAKKFPYVAQRAYVMPFDDRKDWNADHWRDRGQQHGRGGFHGVHRPAGTQRIDSKFDIIRGKNFEENWSYVALRVSSRMVKKWLRGSNYTNPQCSWCRLSWSNTKGYTHTADIASDLSTLGWKVVLDSYEGGKGVLRLCCFSCASTQRYVHPPGPKALEYTLECENAPCRKHLTLKAETLGQARYQATRTHGWRYVYDTLLCEECFAKFVAQGEKAIQKRAVASPNLLSAVAKEADEDADDAKGTAWSL